MSFPQVICSQCTLSPPLENIRKPHGFLMFSGGRERVHQYFHKYFQKITLCGYFILETTQFFIKIKVWNPIFGFHFLSFCGIFINNMFIFWFCFYYIWEEIAGEINHYSIISSLSLSQLPTSIFCENRQNKDTTSIVSRTRTFIRSTHALREKCPITEFFLVCIFLYSVQIQENAAQKNSVFGHFSRSDEHLQT